MAEKFEDVVNKLGKATKKPSLSKAPIVVAVQLVDDKGKVIKEDGGAAATEDKRETLNREKKRANLLKRIAEALEGGKKAGAGKGIGKDEKKKGWTFGKGLLASMGGAALGGGAGAIVGTALAGLGVGAIVVGGVLAAINSSKMAIKAWGEAEEGKWGTVDKISAGFGAFLGGKKEGGDIWNALAQSGKWAVKGMTAGLAFGLPGVIVGGILGAVLGGIMGWIGGEKIAEWVDGTVLAMRNIFNLPELLSPEQQAEADKENKKLATQISTLEEKIVEYKKIIASDSSTLQERIDARVALRAAEKEVETKQDTIATNNRRVAESALAAQDKLLATNTKNLLEAQKEERIATRRFNNAKSRLFWAELIHGKESEQYKEALNEYTETEGALTDRKAHVVQIKDQRTDLKTKRSDLRTEIDKEHQTFMGDTRLFFKGEMEWQKTFTNKMSKSWAGMKEVFQKSADWVWSPGVSHPDGSKTTTKLFGVTLAMPNLGLQEKWDNLKFYLTHWFKTNIFDAGGDAQFGTDKKTSLRIFGFDLDFPNMTETLKSHWDNFKEKIKGIVGWIYTPSRDAVGTGGTGVYAGSPMILFGMEVPSLPNMKDAVKTKWANFEKFIEGIGAWIYSPAQEAKGESAAKGMILFGMEIPSLPNMDFLSMKNIKTDINKLLPEWIKDPEGWATRNFQKLEKWAKDLLPELPELGDIIPDISFDFPNPMNMIGDAIHKQLSNIPKQGFPGVFEFDGQKWKNWILGMIGGVLMDIFPTSTSQEVSSGPAGNPEMMAKQGYVKKALGGPFQSGRPMLVGELGPELILPNTGGMVLSAQRTAAIQEAGLQRGAGASAGGGATLVNAPVTSINNSSSNMTNTTTSFSHPSQILNAVNAAA